MTKKRKFRQNEERLFDFFASTRIKKRKITPHHES